MEILDTPVNPALDAITSRMNAITQKLTETLDASDDLFVTSNDLTSLVDKQIVEFQDKISYNVSEDKEVTDLRILEFTQHVLQAQQIKDDFEMLRRNLKESSDKVRQVLNSLTEELMYAEPEGRAATVMAFAELNKAQNLNIKLFIDSYKDLSTVLLNLSKIQKQSGIQDEVKSTTNILNIETNTQNAKAILERLKGN